MRIWISTLLLLAVFRAHAQFSLQINLDTGKEMPAYPSKFKDSISIIRFLTEKKLQWIGQGFAEASVDSLSFEKKKATATLHKGRKYHLTVVNLEAIPLALRPRKKHYSPDKTVPFSPFQLSQYLAGILDQATENGYPVARVHLDSTSIHHDTLFTKIILSKGPFIRYGHLETHGKIDMKSVFLQNYLQLNDGQPFNLHHVQEIPKKMADLDFVQLAGSPHIQIRGDEAIIGLPLKEKKANQFNFLIGVLPNNNETKKLLLVGNALVDFKNLLGFGERLYLKFDQTRPQTQQLALKTNWPYPFNLPGGLDASFDLYKRDSSYININGQIAARYYLNGQDYLKVFWHSIRSNLLSINTNQLITSKQLPANLDFHSNVFGLEYGIEKLDYRLNPRKGWSLRTKVGAGILRHPPNPKIIEIKIPNAPEFSFQALYDSIGQKSWELRSEIQVNAYFPLFKNSVIALANKSAWLYSPATIAQNQLFRIGGNQLMRGFDEESIFAAFYNVSSLEYRLLVGSTSYLYTFGDYGFVQYPSSQNNQFIDTGLFGFGAGMSFQTNAGLFRISYALGKQDSRPLDTRSAKIHLGFQSVF